MMECIKNYDNAVKAYLREVRQTGMSEQTITNYRGCLERFRAFWVETEPADEPKPEDIRNFRDKLLDEGLKAKTVKQYLVELKTFFTLASDPDFGYFSRNPVGMKAFPKITDADDRIYDKILPPEDIEKLWRNSRPAGAMYWERNYAMVTLLLDGKIRNSELLDMKLSDIDFEEKEVIIPKGKGKKRRWVRLSDITITAIKLYLLSGIRPEGLSDTDLLFGTTAAKEYGKGRRDVGEWRRGTRQWLSKIVEQHVANVTGKHGFRSHSLRHNGAVLDLQTSKSKEEIQAQLGHSSIVTTELYTDRLKSARHSRHYREALEARDICARENAETLAMVVD